MLDACIAQGIEMIAITDHWKVDSALQLIADAEERDIVALPGFEANSAEGIHILVIFDAGTDAAKINAAIGACGVDPGCKNGSTGIPFTDMVEKMTAQGALVIPAHANIPNSGLLTGRGEQPLVKKITHPDLHAICVTPSQPDGIDQAAIIAGTKPYNRPHPLSIVYSDDVTKPDRFRSSPQSPSSASTMLRSSPTSSTASLKRRPGLSQNQAGLGRGRFRSWQCRSSDQAEVEVPRYLVTSSGSSSNQPNRRRRATSSILSSSCEAPHRWGWHSASDVRISSVGGASCRPKSNKPLKDSQQTAYQAMSCHF